jgi:hypothetical protein
VSLKSGKLIKIKTVIFRNVQVPKVAIGPGGEIALRNPAFKGTFGCVLEDLIDGSRYALTCSHVVNGGKADNLGGSLKGKKKPVFDSVGNQLSVVSYAVRDATLDIALVGPISSAINNSIAGGTLKPHREVTTEDVRDQLPIKIYGAKSQGTGVLKNKSEKAIQIQFSNGIVEMKGLLLFSRQITASSEWEAISVSGDSGAIITDKDDQPIAMLVAGNNSFSYGIPMSTIFDHLYMKIG